MLGVLGRTGSGKTTITRLLFRLYDPTRGGIKLGGINLRDASIKELRQHVGMVTQDIQVFHASVRDNLTLFDRSIADSKIEQVLEDLELTSGCAASHRGWIPGSRPARRAYRRARRNCWPSRACSCTILGW